MIANIDCFLGSFGIFQGIRTSIAKKPFIFCDLSEGSGPPAPSPLDPPMLKILAQREKEFGSFIFKIVISVNFPPFVPNENVNYIRTDCFGTLYY